MLVSKIIIFHLLIQNIGCNCGPAGRLFETDTTKLGTGISILKTGLSIMNVLIM
jgi:hypothetical protein